VARQRQEWNEAHRRFKVANPGRAAANQRSWAKRNPEKARESARKYRQTHAAEVARKAHERYWEDPEKARAKASQSRAACAARERTLRHAEMNADLQHDASTRPPAELTLAHEHRRERDASSHGEHAQEPVEQRLRRARAIDAVEGRDAGLERSREQKAAEKEKALAKSRGRSRDGVDFEM
jgi:hypothetical protein